MGEDEAPKSLEELSKHADKTDARLAQGAGTFAWFKAAIPLLIAFFGTLQTCQSTATKNILQRVDAHAAEQNRIHVLQDQHFAALAQRIEAEKAAREVDSAQRGLEARAIYNAMPVRLRQRRLERPPMVAKTVADAGVVLAPPPVAPPVVVPPPDGGP